MKFDKTEVWGFEHALRGMRNPLQSHNKSDSFYGCECGSFHDAKMTPCQECLYSVECSGFRNDYIVGVNDLSLAQRLVLAGSEHAKFVRQIFVSVDITAPLYWWKEFDTYKIGTVANSTSTMHKIHEKEFTMDDFSCGNLFNDEEQGSSADFYLGSMVGTIYCLNKARKMYHKTNDKKYWWQLIQLLPSSYNQKRTITMNYENLRNIYFQRRNHKLDEWSVDFIDWIKTLPYAEELIMLEKEKTQH